MTSSVTTPVTTPVTYKTAFIIDITSTPSTPKIPSSLLYKKKPFNQTSPPSNQTSPPLEQSFAPPSPSHCPLFPLSHLLGCSLGLIKHQDSPPPRIQHKPVTEPSWPQQRTDKAFQNYHYVLWSLRSFCRLSAPQSSTTSYEFKLYRKKQSRKHLPIQECTHGDHLCSLSRSPHEGCVELP